MTFALSNFELQEGRQAHISIWAMSMLPAIRGKHITVTSLESTPEERMGKDTDIIKMEG